MTTETVRDPSSSRGADQTDSRRWLILAVVGLAQVMVILDTTVVKIALPSAQRALRFSNGDRQWVITAYALAVELELDVADLEALDRVGLYDESQC